MTNIEKYNGAFKSVFNVEADELNGDFIAEDIEKWDSITHLALITSIEDAFDVMLDSEDILDFRSYDVGKRILSKYDVPI